MFKNKFFLALYASTTVVTINLIGRLMLAEIIALLTLPFINIGQLLRSFKGLRIVLVCLSVFLVAQIISDFVNNSDSNDFLRGWSVIVFSLISTLYLVNYLSKNPNGIIYYFFVLFLIRLIFGEGDLNIGLMDENTNYFKARFVGFINPAIMLLSYYLFTIKKRSAVILIFFAYGLICMVLDARSNGLIYLISAFLLYIKTAHIRLNGSKIIAWGIILSAIFYVGYIFYVNQVLYHGLGGTNSQTQLEKASNPYNPFELIYLGRTDFFVLGQAVADNPMWGHGSWGKDPINHYAILSADLSKSSTIGDLGYIPAHSVFLGVWAYSGFIGFLAIFYMFMTLFKHFILIFKTSFNSNIFPIVLITFVDMIWAYLFSPLGLLRTTFPIFAALIIVEYGRLRRLKKVRKPFYHHSIVEVINQKEVSGDSSI